MTGDIAQNGAERKRRGKRDSADDATPPFEAQLEALDGLVTALEDGRLPLEEALSLYERGMRLAKACQERLDTAELRVRRLRASVATEDADGDAFALDDFETEE